MKKRQEDDQWQREKDLRRRTLEQAEQTLRERKEEIAGMEKELAQLPAKIDQAIREAEGNLAKKLTEKQQIETTQLELKYQAELKFRDLKISNQEAIIKSQEKEVEDLRKQLTETSRQLKEMAVSAISGRGSNNQTELNVREK